MSSLKSSLKGLSIHYPTNECHFILPSDALIKIGPFEKLQKASGKANTQSQNPH